MVNRYGRSGTPKRDVEDAIPYGIWCNIILWGGAGCRGRHPLRNMVQYNFVGWCGMSRTPSPTTLYNLFVFCGGGVYFFGVVGCLHNLLHFIVILGERGGEQEFCVGHFGGGAIEEFDFAFPYPFFKGG